MSTNSKTSLSDEEVEFLSKIVHAKREAVTINLADIDLVVLVKALQDHREFCLAEILDESGELSDKEISGLKVQVGYTFFLEENLSFLYTQRTGEPIEGIS